MSVRRRLNLLLATAVATVVALCVLSASSALAAPFWNLDVHHDQTNFPPGGTAELSFDIRNIGSTASTGATTLHVALPAGLTFVSNRLDVGTLEGSELPWECPAATGKQSFSCTTASAIDAERDVRNLLVTVAVAPEATGDLVARASLSGGGAPEAPPAANCEPGVGACALERIHVDPDPASFGIVEGSWIADFFNADEVTPVRQAGSHPELATFTFDVNSIEGGLTQAKETQVIPAGSLRHVEVDLPQGFVGNPTAIGECSPNQLESETCPASSQVGRVDITTQAGSGAATHFDLTAPIFNMEHSRGSVTDLAFTLADKAIHIKAALDPSNNYSIRAVTPDINEAFRAMSTRITIWGVPGDPSHDVERGRAGFGHLPIPTKSGIPEKPFLTLPTQCETDAQMTLSHYDSWQESGVFGPEVEYELPGRFTGCERLSFEPAVSVDPTSRQADSATGLNVHVHVPQNENPNGLGTPPVKETVVRLPEGMSFSPSVANGLSACSLAQMKLGTNDEVGCPDASRIGEVVLSTPLLLKPLEGSVYLASQYDNPFGSLFALYLVLHDNEERGLLIKLSGKVEADAVTGQITTTFADTPQLPFEDLTLKFRSGPRAPLVNPPTCGAHETAVRMSSWARPGEPLNLSSSYQVTEGADGAPCPPGGVLAFNPTIVAGTINNLAGSYSPLYMQINHGDGEQQITSLITMLPPGVTANLTGVPFCSDAAIALARNKTGAQEEAEPSCPAGSQIGHTIAEVGVGSVLTSVHGGLFLGGPYQGAPFSIAAITSAVVGPYDLRTVVVHLPLFIDPRTATVTVGSSASEQIPHIIKGVIVHLRSLRLYVDRPNFTLNPTSCERLTFSATVTGSGQSLVSPTDDVPVSVSNPFQAADCASLAFKPGFAVSTSGRTSKADGASLTVKLTYPKAPLGTQANIRQVKVELPKQLPSRLTTLQKACTAAQFRADPAGCPAASVVGHARAVTPILPVPLEGPAYFVSNGGEAFPNLIMVLQGYGVTIDLVGSTFINKQGVTSSTFKTVPDQPVSSFELTLPQGPFSALAANGDLCSLTKTVTVKKKVVLKTRGHKRTVTRSVKQTQPASLTMPSEFVAQNGATIHQTTPISVTGCTKAKPIKKKAKHAKKAKKAKRKG
jgi:uncharacterized repeat protein (TIGR01451 family)